MNAIQTVFIPLLFSLLFTTTSWATPTQEAVTMTLPQSVLQEAISKSLPQEFTLQSSTLLGSLSIDRIHGLQLRKDTLSSHITLTGHQLNIVTTIAGHNLRMKIGSLTMGFQCDATIRFDAETQTLYIKPFISELHSTDKQKTELAAILVPLLNNREFPLPIEKLRPITADTGNKRLSIAMRINDISIQTGRLLLSILPQITSKSK